MSILINYVSAEESKTPVSKRVITAFFLVIDQLERSEATSFLEKTPQDPSRALIDRVPVDSQRCACMTLSKALFKMANKSLATGSTATVNLPGPIAGESWKCEARFLSPGRSRQKAHLSDNATPAERDARPFVA